MRNDAGWRGLGNRTAPPPYDMSHRKNGSGRPPVVLAVLDGWGIAPPGPGNAIELAKRPFMRAAQKDYPYTQLLAHGRYVGLLPHQEGNSEAGHMNIGAGRIVRQDIVYVTEAIKDRTFFKKPAFLEAVQYARQRRSAVHIMGLLTDSNSAHASPDHLYAMLDLVHQARLKKVFLHLFMDGRDAPPFGSLKMLHELDRRLHPEQRIASVMGRFYAMDRNKWWRRTELAYNAIAGGQGLAAPDAQTAVTRAYNRGESDEFILPSVIVDKQHRPIGPVGDRDVIIFFNLRSDRARQIAKPFVQDDFEAMNDGAFKRGRVPKDIRFVALTDFGPDLVRILTAFPSHDIQRGLTETLAPFRQFYIAESEKYAHVTYFMNGGFADPLRGEERMRVPSMFIPHYDARPEMRAETMTDEVVRRLKSGVHDFICINYANADMVGHTGNLAATVKACALVDKCLARLAKEVLARKGELIITGDHGNAEQMLNEETGEVMTEHTANPVPLHIVGERLRRTDIGEGMLADVAPTILDLMDIPKPREMSGFSLLRA